MWARLCPELTGFAGGRVWVPEMRSRGMLWVLLWSVALGCQGVRESRKLSVRRRENATWEGFGLSLVLQNGRNCPLSMVSSPG